MVQASSSAASAAAVVLMLCGVIGPQHNAFFVDAARCPQPCLSGVCDDVTGTCVVDWGSGLDSGSQGKRAGCPQGFFGADCTEVCSVNCVDTLCDQDTGHCTKGCQAGFTGRDCTTVCINGYYGVNCTVPCPEHCKDDACTPHTGVCADGCEDGFWGSDCSLGVEFGRSTPEEKRHFYSHLSAEGKSLLLFLLTSRYDQDLARAQFEIQRAVQDRDQIQHLLQG